MKFSVIVPAYNVEEYLGDCVESLLCQDVTMEIILINDGSTDETGSIADRYTANYDNIRVLHQTHKGPSVARNRGLEIAQGEYIAFIDSDDWIEKGVLGKLYQVAIESRADMVMGNNTFHYPDGSERNLFAIPSSVKNRTYTGTQCFIALMETHAYYPMVWTYIYKHEWIKRHHLRFDAGIIHEDEVWTQIALCLADGVVLTDLDFYHYRKREGSIMHTLKRKNRLQALFHVIRRLVAFAAGYADREDDYLLKSWMYVNIYRIMRTAWQTVSLLNDSTVVLPGNDIVDLYNQVRVYMPVAAKERCEEYYSIVKANEQKYLKWKNNPWDRYISQLPKQALQNKRIILIYNHPEWYDVGLSDIDKFPSDYAITFDRKYLDQAYAIVFHLPNLFEHLDDDLDKPKNQLWVAWSMTYEEGDDPWAKDEDFNDLFDLRMTYQERTDGVYTYYTGFGKEGISVDADRTGKDADPFVRLCEGILINGELK